MKRLRMFGRIAIAVLAGCCASPARAVDPVVLLDEADSIEGVDGLTVAREPVASGEVAARWEAGRGVAWQLPVPEDWRAFNLLRFRLHSNLAEAQTFVVNALSENPDTDGGDYYHHQLTVSRQGWQEILIPLSAFGPARTPRGWNHIEALAFHSRGWNIEPVTDSIVHIDRMVLEHDDELAREPAPPRRQTVTVELPDWNGALRYRAFPWDDIRALCDHDPEARGALQTVVKSARRHAEQPIRERVYSLEELPENRRDGRYRQAGDNAEVFALAMSDCSDGSHLRRIMFPMAVAARLTGDETLREAVVRQLREVTTWSPLQRPGWTQYRPDATLPPGGDGNWLATGYSIRAIVDTLSVLDGQLPEDLVAELRDLLQKEVESVVDDWVSRRPWFVRADYPATNQWALPSAALVYACLYLGEERNREAYDLGVENLARTCMSQGENGSWHEGLAYGLMSAEYVFWAAWAAQRAGDERLSTLPFVRNYGGWVVQLTMPGRYTVNAFDCGRYSLSEEPHPSLMLAAIVAEDPTVQWACNRLFPVLPSTPLGLLFRNDTGDATANREAPDPFAVFPGQQVVAWKSSWELNSAMGVWIRGGSVEDSHSHRDNGHVTVLNGKRPILIECGTPSYSDPDLDTKYAEAAGHNVLQAATQVRPRGRGCHTPVTVERLDDTGGRVTVDGTRAYTDTASWQRTVSWNADGQVTIEDRAGLLRSVPAATEWFRFHTGATGNVAVTPTENGAEVRWDGATIAFAADHPIEVIPMPWPDRSGLGEHVCLSVRATDENRTLALTTSVTFTPAVDRLADLPDYEQVRVAYPEAGGGAPPLTILQAEEMIGTDERFTVSDSKVGAEVCIYNWDHVGQKLEATFAVREAGLFRVIMKCCTGANHGIPVRSVALDGTIPFREAADIRVRSTGGWSNTTNDWILRTLGETTVDGGFLFYLDAGEHTIRLVNEGGGGLNVDFVAIVPADRPPADVRNELRQAGGP